MTTGGGNSSHHNLVNAVEILHRCLSDSGVDIQEAHRIKLTKLFQHELNSQFNSMKQHDYNNNSHKTEGNNGQLYSWSKEISELLDILDNCSISPSESKPTPRSSELEPYLLRYLFCFTLFDKAAVIKKRQLVYWWVGQGLIDVDSDIDVEEAANETLRKLLEAGAIEQVISNRGKNKSNKFRLILSISDLEQQIHDYLKVGKLTNSDGTTIDKQTQSSTETLINSGVSKINITRDWLQKMKILKVVYLGRWSNDAEQHIEVENVEFQEAFKHLKQVKFISFRGISRIMKLANEICILRKNLRVLDLQACSNLEELPKNIGNLKNLTHLDLSECYLIDRIPKGIISLVKLQVLEGFVIGDVDSSSSCKFEDLANHLGTTLIKLSIRTRNVSFPDWDDLKAFPKFVKLLKLKVEWVEISGFETKTASLGEEMKGTKVLRSRSLQLQRGINYKEGLPHLLQKLEVQSIPQTALENLLVCNNNRSNNLEKLYIIGGKLNDLTDQGKHEWKTVKTMQLKYLTRLHMTWRQFRASFPHVSYLEVTQCPHLSFFPCDKDGIWGRKLLDQQSLSA